MAVLDTIESTRQDLQNRLDSAKTQQERNRLGQYSTPIKLATDIIRYAKSLLPASLSVRFLDPAFGTGAFYSALIKTFPPNQIKRAEGYEIDNHYADDAIKLWAGTPLKLHIRDFTKAQKPQSNEDKFNLIICNPPYVRHHHLSGSDKQRLRGLAKKIAQVNLSGLSGLYCYFLCAADVWLAEGGLSGWLIPSEFMDVNYGREVKEYLLKNVTLLRIHRFNPSDVQFDDALVSSAIVWFKKDLPPANHAVEFTFGGRWSNLRSQNLSLRVH
ncbi:MAG: Eco57I restriction-modification methylase domain-containing protein [Acidobacteriota bacterium]|nr:Eco57I restriction-modification methylase domain-containing protein [Acidobacteriota bacterium]